MKLKKRSRIRVFSIIASLLMVFSLVTPGVANAEPNKKLHESLNNSNVISKDKVSSRLLESFGKADTVTFLIKFKEKTDTEKVASEAKQDAVNANLSAQKTELMQRSAVVSELKTTSIESQQNVKQYLNSKLKRKC